MKVLKLNQGSEEWLEFRLGKVSGSKLREVYSRTNPSKEMIVDYLLAKGVDFETKATIPVLMGYLSLDDIGQLKAQQDRKDGFYRLVAERIARPITPNDYADQLGDRKFSMMERGHILEPEAIAAFEEKTGKKVERGDIVWQSDDDDEMMVSPDGSILRDGKIVEAVEVKCPDSHTVIRCYDEQTYPNEYYEQIIQYFIINDDLEKLHFVIYTDVVPSLPIQIYEIKRKDVQADITLMKAYEKAILKQVDELAERLAF